MINLIQLLLLSTLLVWAITITIVYSSQISTTTNQSQDLVQKQNIEPWVLCHFPIEKVNLDVPLKWRSYMGQHEQFHRRVMLRTFEVLPKDGLIIDVGCYVGDMALPWGKLGWNVLAIDPSPDNIQLIHQCMAKNDIITIETRTCGVGSKKNKLKFQGPLEHLSFVSDPNAKDTSEQSLSIYTLDEIVNNRKVSYMHVDVEDFEYELLQGAYQTIEKWRPVISIETHSTTSPIVSKQTLDWLLQHQYHLWVIPECCGARSDCRNVLCLPKEKTWPNRLTDDLQFISAAEDILKLV